VLADLGVLHYLGMSKGEACRSKDVGFNLRMEMFTIAHFLCGESEVLPLENV